MRAISNLRVILWLAGLVLLLADEVILSEAGAVQPSSQVLTNVAEFCRSASAGFRANYQVQLEGVICWVGPTRNLFILQDDSGAVPISMDFGGATIHIGQRVRIGGECMAQRSGLGFVMTQALVVDNDGLHPPIERMGSAPLKSGLNPIRVHWFNSRGEGVLKVSFQGPGVPLQPVPPTSLFRIDGTPEDGATNLVPGLNYRCWEGEWDFVPNFNQISVARSGAVPGFDVSATTRPESVGMEFTGFLKVPQDGLYSFYLGSDDGSLLWVGQPSLLLTTLGDAEVPEPQSLSFGKVLSEDEEFRRWEVEGEVTFVNERHRSLRLEMRAGAGQLVLEIADAHGAHPELLRGSRLRTTGICQGTSTLDGQKRAGYVWVPNWSGVEVLAIAPDRWELQPLVLISNLTAKTATKISTLVRIRGQVRSVGSNHTMVVKDETGEVAVNVLRVPPASGSLVEVVGMRTGTGDQLALQEAYVREVVAPSEDSDEGLPLLTTIKDVWKLSPEQASLAYPVRVRGVVTAKFENGLNLVIQDADQGIYIGVALGDTRGPVEIGDACEVVGITRTATWAPSIVAQQVIRLGLGNMPEPLRPSWDQILNGSLDSQYVEVQGLVTDVHDTGVKLLTRVGRIDIESVGNSREQWQPFQDALVRVRGCVLAVYDRVTRVAISGKIRLIHPSIAVDEYPPANPFATSVRGVSSLRAFDSQASPFQRVKVAGQILHASADLYCLMDGTNGLRFFPKKAVILPVGALVEVVGILDLNGPSPILLEAVVRVMGLAELPEPMVLSGSNLLSGARDNTRVRMESILLNVNRDAGDQVLELRTESQVYRARLCTNQGVVKSIPLGSRLALTGVYQGKGGNWAAGRDIEAFDLVLSSPSDIKVLEQPSWWTPKRLLMLVGSMAAVLFLALGWIRVLHRQVDERTRQLAQQIQARQRVEQQRAVEQERTRLARDLHDDLGGGLTEISMLGFLANDGSIPSERKTGYLQQMTEKARQLVTALDAIVWAVNPRYDSLSSLAAYYSLYAQRFLGLASVQCRLEIADSFPECPLDSTMRHSFFLAFKEALSNVVRHARATEVQLRIKVENDELVVAVADNGCGLQPDATSECGMDGLENMKARMSALGGQCEIQSVPTRGTTVVFRVSLPKE